MKFEEFSEGSCCQGQGPLMQGPDLVFARIDHVLCALQVTRSLKV